MKLNIRLMLIGAVLPLAFASWAADTYKWTDDSNQVHFTQQPPKDRPYEVIKGKREEVVPEAPRPESVISDKKPAVIATKKNPQEAAEDDRAVAACDAAQANKRTLTEFTRIKVADKNGEQRFLTDEERAEKLKTAEKDIESYCKSKSKK